MTLNQVTLRELIAKNLFGDDYESYLQYVIPRKGNFFNPQCSTDISTYAVYYITSKRKRTTNIPVTEGLNLVHNAVVQVSVEIQFIGKEAEGWANNFLFWDDREDVRANFGALNAQLENAERVVQTVPFQQEGFNGELSYLASFSAIASLAIEEEEKETFSSALILKGGINIKE